MSFSPVRQLLYYYVRIRITIQFPLFPDNANKPTNKEKTMNCPKCNAEMKIVKYDYVQVDKCTHCNGIWFDVMEQEDLLQLKGSESIDSNDILSKPDTNTNQPIICPKCNVKMLVMHDIIQNHIEFEKCGSCHGIFLDANEFSDLNDLDIPEFFKSLTE